MDFIDLDDDVPFEKFNHKYPLSPSFNNSTIPEESAIFISSTFSNLKDAFNCPEKVSEIMKFETTFGTVQFDSKHFAHEGRDSKVFRGSLTPSNATTIPVAVKIYKNDSSALRGAEKEIEIAQKFTKNRPDFLKLFHYGNVDENTFLSVWEWIDGGRLDEFVIVDDEHLSIISSIAESLNLLHSQGIAHHDIKPQNILISSDSKRIILIDFGDSKSVKDNKLLPIEEGIGLGTLAYTAPELLSRKSAQYDPLAADVYSFGVLLFYILNDGKILPFSQLIPHRAVQLILTVQKGFFTGGFNAETPKDSPFFPLMKKCLQTDPLLRPKSSDILSEITEIKNKFF